MKRDEGVMYSDYVVCRQCGKRLFRDDAWKKIIPGIKTDKGEAFYYFHKECYELRNPRWVRRGC